MFANWLLAALKNDVGLLPVNSSSMALPVPLTVWEEFARNGTDSEIESEALSPGSWQSASDVSTDSLGELYSLLKVLMHYSLKLAVSNVLMY